MGSVGAVLHEAFVRLSRELRGTELRLVKRAARHLASCQVNICLSRKPSRSAAVVLDLDKGPGLTIGLRRSLSGMNQQKFRRVPVPSSSGKASNLHRQEQGWTRAWQISVQPEDPSESATNFPSLQEKELWVKDGRAGGDGS